MAEPTVERSSDLTQAAAQGAALVPSWLDNLAALSWRVLAIVAFVVVAWYVGTLVWTVTASVAVAIVIAAVFAPYVLRLRANGRSRTAAAGIVWLIAIAVTTGMLLIVVAAFLPHVASLLSRINEGLGSLQGHVADLQGPPWIAALADQTIEAMSEAGGDMVGDIVASAAGAITVLVLAAFLVFFFLRDGDKAWLWIFQSLGQQKRELITTAGDDALARVGGYLRGTTVLAAIFGVTNYVFLLLLGTPLALPLAVLSFMATYIPYFGSLVTTGIILLVTLGALGPGTTLVLLVAISIRGAAVSYWVRPAIYGRTVSMHPALVLLVLPAGLALGGVVGLFAAVPVTAVILTVARAAISIIEPDPAPLLPELVPAWLDRVAQWSWRALVIIALMAVLITILTAIPLVVIPVILATIFAATLWPLVLALMQRGHARTRAAATAVAGTVLVVVAVLALSMVSLVEQAAQIGSSALAGAESVDDAGGGHLGLVVDALGGGISVTLGTIVAVTQSLAAIGVVVLLSTLLAFYFLRDGGRLWAGMMSHTRPDAVPQLSAAGSRAFDALGGYMIGTAAISFVGAASQFVIMVVLGLPLALPVFVLSFFGGFIPYIGSFITTGIAFLIAVAVGEPIDVVVMLIWTVVFNLVQGNVVSPIVYGRTVHIHPAIVLVAIPAGSAVAGILGILLVVPAVGVVAATWRTILSVMGAQPEPADPAAVEPPPGDTPPGEPAPEPT